MQKIEIINISNFDNIKYLFILNVLQSNFTKIVREIFNQNYIKMPI